MEINKKIIESVDMDLATYEDYLQELANVVLEQEVSKYPIFIMHQQDVVQIGRTVIDAARSKTKWSVNISHLEEFVNRKIVPNEKVENFKQVYKSPLEYICIFVLANENASFVFRPYTNKKN